MLKAIEEALRRGAAATFAEQGRIAQKKIYSRRMKTRHTRTGHLMDMLTAASTSTALAATSVTIRSDYPHYIKMLDMKEGGNMRIYNRPLWGIFYRQTLKDIRSNCREALRTMLGETLRS